MPRTRGHEIEHVAELSRTVGDERPEREEAARLGQAVAHHGDERRRVDVPSGEDHRDGARSGDAAGEHRGKPDGAGALDEQLRALQAQDERLRDLLVRDGDGVVQRALEDRPGELAPVLDGDSVGDREPRLADDPHDPRAGLPRAKRDRDSRREPAPADGDQDGLGLRRLLGELEPDRPLPRDDARLLERMHERGAGALDVGPSGGDGLLEALADELRRATVRARRLDLRHRRVLRHEDRRRDPGLACRPRDGLAVVAGARRDDARLPLLRAEGRDRVVRAADLEGPRALEVLRLQEHGSPGETRERLGRIERRLASDAAQALSRSFDVRKSGSFHRGRRCGTPSS